MIICMIKRLKLWFHDFLKYDYNTSQHLCRDKSYITYKQQTFLPHLTCFHEFVTTMDNMKKQTTMESLFIDVVQKFDKNNKNPKSF